MAALEGGIGALALASGMAAIRYAIRNITMAGRSVVTTPQLYGPPTRSLHIFCQRKV